MKENNNAVLWALLAGAATGAVIGILFAPAKGSETRAKIKNGAMRFANRKREEEEHFQDEFNVYKEEEIVDY